MTYNDLVTAVQDYTQNTYTTTDINTMIQQAEQRIYNSVQLANLRKNVTSILAPNNPYLSVPPDFLSAYSCAIYPASTGTYTFLLNKDVNFMRQAYPNQTATALPKYYAIFGTETGNPNTLTIMFGPTPDQAYNIELHYFYYPQSIVTANATWLGNNFDSALLNATLVEAITFMKGEQDLVQLYTARFNEAMAMLKNLGDGKERRDSYRDGQIRIPVQ